MQNDYGSKYIFWKLWVEFLRNQFSLSIFCFSFDKRIRVFFSFFLNRNSLATSFKMSCQKFQEMFIVLKLVWLIQSWDCSNFLGISWMIFRHQYFWLRFAMSWNEKKSIAHSISASSYTFDIFIHEVYHRELNSFECRQNEDETERISICWQFGDERVTWRLEFITIDPCSVYCSYYLRIFIIYIYKGWRT